MAAVVVLLILIFVIIYSSKYNSKEHIEYTKENLRADAKIIDFDVKLVGFKDSRKYRTKVIFDDGFTYISHYTHREDSLLSYTITLTETMKEVIIKEAIRAHYEAMGLKIPKQYQLSDDTQNVKVPKGFWQCVECGEIVSKTKNRCTRGHMRP